MSHGDPKNPKKNPHPVKRYEITATADAPGPWDSVKGYLEYQVINDKCTPEDKFLGVHAMPQIVGQDIEMTRVDEKTWRGYLYRDLIEDEDYYGLGVCHWDTTSVGIVAITQGIDFGWAGLFESLLHDSPETSYFKKNAYGDLTQARYGAPNYSALRPEYKKNPSEFFPVSIAVKEVTP